MTIDKNIPIKNIYYMLTYAFKELKHNNYEHIVGENFDNIYDLFAESIIYTCSHYLISSEAAKPANLPEVHAKPEAKPSYAG